MPPRRSSRAASATRETPIEPLPIKRKRGQAAEPDNQEKENVAKVPSRTRRSVSARPSVTPASKARRSTRSKTSLPELPETENEEHEEQSDALPPVKKARPSIDHVDEEEMKLEEDDEVEAKPKRGKRGSSLAKPSQPVAMDIDEEALDGHRSTAKAREGTSSKSTLQSDDEMLPHSESEEDDVKPVRKGRRARKPKVTVKQTTKTTVIENSDDDIEAPPSAQPHSQHNGAAQVVSNLTPEIEEEEEKSLFDLPPMPEPSSLPQTIPEEPAGPKSRLVIHKMALINFKSYAGRQEIGPFHKVINIRQTTVMKINLFFDARSRSRLSWGPMGQENPIPSTLSSSYLDTAPRR